MSLQGRACLLLPLLQLLLLPPLAAASGALLPTVWLCPEGAQTQPADSALSCTCLLHLPCREYVSALYDWHNTAPGRLNLTLWANDTNVGGGQGGGAQGPPEVQRWSQPLNLAGAWGGRQVARAGQLGGQDCRAGAGADDERVHVGWPRIQQRAGALARQGTTCSSRGRCTVPPPPSALSPPLHRPALASSPSECLPAGAPRRRRLGAAGGRQGHAQGRLPPVPGLLLPAGPPLLHVAAAGAGARRGRWCRWLRCRRRVAAHTAHLPGGRLCANGPGG